MAISLNLYFYLSKTFSVTEYHTSKLLSKKFHQVRAIPLLSRTALLNLGMIFFERGALRPFQKKSYMKSATPAGLLHGEQMAMYSHSHKA